MNGEHFRDYFDSQYLGNWDLPRNQNVVVEIVKVEKGTLVGQRGKKDKKAILHFRGKEKAMAANITNCKTIAAMYGPNPRSWVGKRIALYVAENVDSPNGPVDAIRIRPTIPEAPRSTSNGRAPKAGTAAVPPPDVAAEESDAAEWQPEEPPPGVLASDHD